MTDALKKAKAAEKKWAARMDRYFGRIIGNTLTAQFLVEQRQAYARAVRRTVRLTERAKEGK